MKSWKHNRFIEEIPYVRAVIRFVTTGNAVFSQNDNRVSGKNLNLGITPKNDQRKAVFCAFELLKPCLQVISDFLAV